MISGIPDSLEGLREVSIHPPHMMDSEGTLLPSSFLPFCVYQTMELGEERPNIPITACSQAVPTVLAGQLCYSLNVSNTVNTKSAMGKQNSLLLFLDTGESRSRKIQKDTTNHKWTNATKSVDISTSNEDRTSVYIETLSEITYFGAGSYAMSGLNRMSGSKRFMQFPDYMKKCQIGSLTDCHNMNYFENLQEQCQCIPWSLRFLNPSDKAVKRLI